MCTVAPLLGSSVPPKGTQICSVGARVQLAYNSELYALPSRPRTGFRGAARSESCLRYLVRHSPSLGSPVEAHIAPPATGRKTRKAFEVRRARCQVVARHPPPRSRVLIDDNHDGRNPLRSPPSTVRAPNRPRRRRARRERLPDVGANTRPEVRSLVRAALRWVWGAQRTRRARRAAPRGPTGFARLTPDRLPSLVASRRAPPAHTARARSCPDAGDRQRGELRARAVRAL